MLVFNEQREADAERQAGEFKGQFDVERERERDKTREQDALEPSFVKKKHSTIDKIKTAILKLGNLVASNGDMLHKGITHAYIFDEYVPSILNADVTGQKLYAKYVIQ
ncbi:hypothetical protein QYM36_004293 [Artemia franciscana]|uniref:Uncharacterized protein n=1 Tax=Artemia franciscana TaxID=6661 RepID=A0AA88HY79_ARTSF|nr:hypothetical protein QYM36_004293 [Artemia franciscana]